MLWLRWSKLSTLQNVLRVILKWRSVSTVLLRRQVPEKEHVHKSYCFIWHTVMSLKIEHKHLLSTFCVEGSLVLSLDQLLLFSPSFSKKWGSVRTPFCHFLNFKEIRVQYWNQFRPILKRKHDNFPVAFSVFYIFSEFSSGNDGSTKAVPVSSCRQPIFGINFPRLLYLCSFSPTCVASVAILGTAFPSIFSGPMS